MAEYKENKVQRRPFPEGTKIDVIMRGDNFGGTHSQVIHHPSNDEHGLMEVLGTVVGVDITDWKIDGGPGDVLLYRKHEEKADGEE